MACRAQTSRRARKSRWCGRPWSRATRSPRRSPHRHAVFVVGDNVEFGAVGGRGAAREPSNETRCGEIRSADRRRPGGDAGRGAFPFPPLPDASLRTTPESPSWRGVEASSVRCGASRPRRARDSFRLREGGALGGTVRPYGRLATAEPVRRPPLGAPSSSPPRRRGRGRCGAGGDADGRVNRDAGGLPPRGAQKRGHGVPAGAGHATNHMANTPTIDEAPSGRWRRSCTRPTSREIEIVTGDVKLRVARPDHGRTPLRAGPCPRPPSLPSPQRRRPAAEPAEGTIHSPIGRHRLTARPSPGRARPSWRWGDRVAAGQTVDDPWKP